MHILIVVGIVTAATVLAIGNPRAGGFFVSMAVCATTDLQFERFRPYERAASPRISCSLTRFPLRYDSHPVVTRSPLFAPKLQRGALKTDLVVRGTASTTVMFRLIAKITHLVFQQNRH